MISCGKIPLKLLIRLVQIGMDFESPPSKQFYLSSLIPLLFAKAYLYLAKGNVFLTPLRNTASLEPANSEILPTETLMEMTEAVKGYL